MEIIPQINNEIEQAKSILVASHRNPEADALASSLAILHHFGKGKKIQVFNADANPYFLEFLPGAQSVIHDLEKVSKDFELAVVVDCAALSRVCEPFPEFLKGKRIINIDHHESGKGFGDLKLINPHASSTAEILYQVFSESGRKISKDTATCLYAAISNDTGSFQFRNTSRAALETAACLVKLGANPAAIARGLYESHPKSRILLMAMAFQTIVFSPDSKRADITLTTEMFQKSGATVPMTEGLVNFLTAVARRGSRHPFQADGAGQIQDQPSLARRRSMWPSSAKNLAEAAMPRPQAQTWKANFPRSRNSSAKKWTS